jgi:phosphoglycolate phosphatase
MHTLIFDFDGVFTDSFRVSLEAFQKLHRKYNLKDISKNDLCELFCGNLWEKHKQYGLKNKDEEEFKKELLEMVEERQEEISFFSGMKEITERLAKKGHSLIIISSNKSSAVQDKLASIQLEDAFTEILGADAPGNKEEKMKNVLGKVGGKTFFITDTLGDIKEVKKFPITTVAVTWGYHSKDLLKKGGPDFLADTPEELCEILA